MHYVVLVKIKSNLLDGIQDTVWQLLEPYSTALEVPPWEIDCSCVNKIANGDADYIAHEKTTKLLGTTLQELRTNLNLELAKFEISVYSKEGEKVWTARKAEWEKHYNKEYNRVLDSHELKNKSDPKCTSCKGKGTYSVTWNPHDKWDWHTVGGRWRNLLDAGPAYTLLDNKWTIHRRTGSTMKVKEVDWSQEHMSNLLVVAVIDENGWHDFRSTKETDTFFDRFIKDEDPETTLVVVDCHT